MNKSSDVSVLTVTQKPDADLSQAFLGRLGVLDVAREVHSEGAVYLGRKGQKCWLRLREILN